jgi:hypothetical protein
MKQLGEIIASLLMLVVGGLVTAWAYQVFWNEVFLNVWQLFETVDVVTIMRIPYGACVAIAFGIGMIRSKKADTKAESFNETATLLMNKCMSRVLMICFTLLVTSIVF